MEKAREFLEKLSSGGGEEITFPPHRPNLESSFYEYFGLRGIRVARIRPGFIYCSFKVPPRLTDGNGNLAIGAIGNLIDILGAAIAYNYEDGSMNVSADISISYISAAKLNDELETISRSLGEKGKYKGTHVLVRNKTTGEIVAEGRHSLFNTATSKM